ncbi:hypothetical protein QVD17_17807 [Tagetes erecta]|uniref:Secreted protein n=1 Tax=Tagetes erecta TaxID=13708 RepID=A0AAD8KXE0_TARER|nr:hypothetical protein QVD17_17807 [Tagetes erecta]
MIGRGRTSPNRRRVKLNDLSVLKLKLILFVFVSSTAGAGAGAGAGDDGLCLILKEGLRSGGSQMSGLAHTFYSLPFLFKTSFGIKDLHLQFAITPSNQLNRL